MHKFAKEIMESVKNEVCGIGKDNLTTEQLEAFKCWTEIAKNIVCFDKDYSIVEAMKKADDEEQKMEMIERYTDYPERKMYDHYRYNDGRFAPKGRGSYRRYTEMTPEMYRNDDYEHLRDVDRTEGRMYYTSTATGGNMATRSMAGNGNMGGTRDYREGRSGMSRRTYMETKEMHKANTPEDKQAKMRELEKYMKELSEDLTEMIADATNEEKTMLKTKLDTLKGKIV